DPSAALGMPAHVTVLYPFKPPRELTADVIRSLDELFSNFSSFSARLVEPKQFLGVLYLAPAPEEAFRRLTEAMTERFPETQPYAGQFGDIIPHLTVAQIADAQLLAEIATGFHGQARGHLPIEIPVTEVALMDNESGRWQVRQRFALGR